MSFNTVLKSSVSLNGEVEMSWLFLRRREATFWDNANDVSKLKENSEV